MSVFKNDVGRPSNKTIMLRKTFKIVGLLIVILLAGFMGYSLKNNNKSDISDKKIEEKENNKESEQKEELNVNSSLVLDLFNNVNRFNDALDVVNDNNYLFNYFYKQDKILNEQVSDEVKFSIIFDKLYNEKVQSLATATLEEYENFKFYLKDINNESIKIFGKTIDVKNILDSNNNVNVGVRGNTFKYNEDGQYFNLVSGGIGDCQSLNLKTKILSAVKYEDKIEITNKIMYIYSSSCDVEELKVFKSVGNSPFDLKEQLDDLTNNVNNMLAKDIDINNYIEKLDEFKWIFTKNNDGNYIFESVEKVK